MDTLDPTDRMLNEGADEEDFYAEYDDLDARADAGIDDPYDAGGWL